MEFLIVWLLCISFVFGKEPMRVAVYYESYCPDCQIFIKEQLVEDWQEFKGNITLDLVPFGNAEQTYVDGHWEFSCQHGEKECVGNKLHACAVYQACIGQETSNCAVNAVTKVLKYVTCVEASEDQQKASSKCAKNAGLDAASILACADGPQGSTLLNYYGNRTAELPVTHEYVPWITINGEHNPEAEQDLRNVICQLRPLLCVGVNASKKRKSQKCFKFIGKSIENNSIPPLAVLS